MPLKIIKKILNKNQSEYRKDYLLDQYVIVTPGRAGRPRDISEQTILKKNEKCVFCPENILNKDVVYRIGDVKLWEVISKKNTFPTVTIDNAKAYGIQEVIIETPDHAKELGDLSLIQIEKVLKMYAQRTSELSHKKNIQYVECFKNQGSKAGASLTHAHSQVFATDVLPPLVLQEIDLAKKYKKDHDT
ncbi:MAG: DUF4931 domain-containing protein, partial [Candidatus Falkowbacteria bacterium]|nr:DUF4931 domain-containing protein [Candidatus Falkowbacteria bacterium]